MSKLYRLVHHNDGKENWQSHEVYVQYIGDYAEGVFTPDINGYGATKEEAFENFKESFRKALRDLNDFVQEMFLNQGSLQITEVDCFGKEISNE